MIRATALWLHFVEVERPEVADFCRSALSIAVIPLEIAEFNGAGLADDRQWANLDPKPTVVNVSFAALGRYCDS